ncbi:hypothetical protein T459_18954 [Capsicum annuum]|uniref:F-box associated beta-propeller type 1 domain-containing protein n=1 Tax=Capsicum annuum TaxID=4072 RepID=A0A2G2Z092_CAPAN|nr:hypothetical protein T459_18954 [Capsicum annuum]
MNNSDDEFVIVTSLKDKKWRKVEFPYHIVLVCNGITFHDRIHYRVCCVDDDNNGHECCSEIIYFDPITEEFHMFPLLEPKSDQVENVIVGLGALNECLCIARLDNDKRDVEILVMKEYEVKESWTSLFSIRNLEIDPCYRALTPLFMTDNGELIFTIKNILDKINILVYDPKNDNIKDIQLANGRKERMWCTICYVECLISPDELLLE